MRAGTNSLSIFLKNERNLKNDSGGEVDLSSMWFRCGWQKQLGTLKGEMSLGKVKFPAYLPC